MVSLNIDLGIYFEGGVFLSDELKSKEYSTSFYMRQPHPASRHAIEGYVESVCDSDAKKRMEQWNNGPDGKMYEFDHVDLIRTENEDSNTNCDQWPSTVCHWELKGNAIYNLYYRKL